MALAGLDELDLSWTLRNTLTINNDVTVEGDVNTTGAIYDGGIPTTITGDNNVWTGNNLFKNFQPTFLAPVADEDMTTFDYMETTFTGVGTALLPLNNVWTGFNTAGALPILTNQATAATNEMVNLNTLNAYLATQTGQLTTANVWTKQNTFTNKVNVPAPLTLAQFGNKTYVDAEIAAYNLAGGNIEYQEILAQSGTSTNITLDPALYTGMYVCMVGSGGFGAVVGAPAVPGTITFGGSGAYAAFKIPAFTGTATYSITAATPLVVNGTSTFTNSNGQALVSVSSGQTPTTSTSNGAGGTVTLFNGMTGVQIIQGTTGIPLTDTASPVQYSFNVGCLNGYGQGGSYNFTTLASVAPTGLYCLLIKFKK